MYIQPTTGYSPIHQASTTDQLLYYVQEIAACTTDQLLHVQSSTARTTDQLHCMYDQPITASTTESDQPL